MFYALSSITVISERRQAGTQTDRGTDRQTSRQKDDKQIKCHMHQLSDRE